MTRDQLIERRTFSTRKAKCKARAHAALDRAKLPYLRARTADVSLQLGDFYEAARKLRDLGLLGERILADAYTLDMDARVTTDIKWTCFTLGGFSRRMYDVASANHWPLKEFPTYYAKVAAEFEAELEETNEEESS